MLLRPDVIAFRHKLGSALLQAGRHGEAEAVFREVLEREPAYAASHLGLARVLDRTQRGAEAAVHYEGAFANEPELWKNPVLRRLYREALAALRRVGPADQFEAALGRARSSAAAAGQRGFAADFGA